ncbi:MAG: DUF4386 domain-containing protein [Chloroflexota bacterium]
MNTNTSRRSTRIAGILIIVVFITGILSVVLPVEDPDYLNLTASNQNQVFVGGFFQFLMIPAYIGFALYLYPILKMKNEALSLGFVGFRLATGMFQLIGMILLPLILNLSQEFVMSDAPNVSYFHTLGDLLRMARDMVNHVAAILSLSLADLLLFIILYRSRLIPRWLSLWGILAIGIAMVASFMVFFQMTMVVTPLYLSMNVPLMLQTLVFATWLIAKGFDPIRLG